MDYEKFKKEIRLQIRAYLPEEMENWKVRIFQKYKVNQQLDAVSLQPPEEDGRNGAFPVFYMQDLYELYLRGNSMDAILKYVCSWMFNASETYAARENDFDTAWMKERVVFQLINYDRNFQMLSDLPHRKFLDLAVIYRVISLDGDGHMYGVIVTHDLLESWDMTEEDLYKKAWENTLQMLPFVLKDASQIVGEECTLVDFENRMYVITNDGCHFGAAAMLYPDILEMAADEIGSSYIILPGSIHELYAVKDQENRLHHWRKTVRYANQNLVHPTEWLSDNLYYYDKVRKTVKILW